MSSYKLLKTYISVMLLFFHTVNSSEARLELDFYKNSCGRAESIVKDEVQRWFKTEKGVAAALVRLHFHDCFVRGCDGSVLLDSTSSNTAEKDAAPNKPSLRPEAFKIINNAKSRLEGACPGVVSCADILAFAARDSIELTGGPYYAVLAGRRDGKTSLAAEALANLPAPTFNLTQLAKSFAVKGLSLEEMVTLSGAHTLGRSLCSSVVNRLYNFNSTIKQDPSLDDKYAKYLKGKCPKGPKNVSQAVYMDPTPFVTDVEYYAGVLSKSVVFTSDQALSTSTETKKLVERYVKDQTLWENKFAAAMVKMGNIGAVTGTTAGQIRKDCRVINGKKVV